jgi:hypothetical protein
MLLNTTEIKKKGATLISDEVFTSLTKKLIPYGDEAIGNEDLRSDYKNYTIHFGNVEEVFEVFEFSAKIKGEWIEAIPTHSQLETMKSLLEKEVERVLGKVKEENTIDDYDVFAEQGLYGYGH